MDWPMVNWQKYSVLAVGLLVAMLLCSLTAQSFTDGNYNRQIDSLQSVIPQQNDTIKLASIVELDRLIASGAPTKILPYLEEGLAIASELGHSYYQGKILNLIGTSQYYLAKYDSAAAYWRKAISICDEMPRDEYEADVRTKLMHSTSLMNLGVISRMRGDYVAALDYYHQSLDIRKTTGYKLGEATCYINIAKIYVDNKNDKRALEYYQQADLLLSKNPAQLYRAGVLNNMALIYQRSGEIEKAKTYFEEALDIYTQIDEPKRVAQVYVNLGKLHRDIEDCGQALDYYSLALVINEETSDRLGTAWCYQYIGNCYDYLEHNESAIRHYTKALDILEELKVTQNQMDCYNGLARVYARMGNFERAFFFKDRFATLKDSVFTERLSVELAEQETKYTTNEHRKEIELREAELQHQSEVIARSKLQNWILIIGFLLVVAVAIIFVQRFRIEAQFHAKLEKQNQELKDTYENLKATVISKEEKEVMIKEIHHRVKNNLQIISSLINIQANSIDDIKMQIMLREVQNRIISMSLLHELLYKAPNLADVEVRPYLDLLLQKLVSIFANETELKVVTNVEVERFGVDTLIPIGLLINEAVTNSLKYAFKGRDKGTITIELKHHGDGYILVMADDGVGLSEADIQGFRKSLGMDLIETFVAQLDGEMELDTSSGTAYRIIFFPDESRYKKRLEESSVPTV